MIFEDREAAGWALAEALHGRSYERPVVLGIPRGGVIVAAAVARELQAPLDVVVPRKIGAPANPELGLGAIAPGVVVLDEHLVRMLQVTPEYLESEIAAQEVEIERRTKAYRDGREPVDLSGATAVLVDDGIATGGTATAAIRWARAQGAASVVLAVPVAPPQAVRRLAQEADEVVVLDEPAFFQAVGQWYRRFDQVSDEEVIAALREAAAS